MAINFATNGSTGFTKPPRVITTTDGFAGCPGTRAAGTGICSTTITLVSNSIIVVEGRLIRACGGNSGRCDTYLNLDGTTVHRFIDYCDGATSEWVQHVLSWMGPVAAGTHTFIAASSCANAIGCGDSWGHLQFLIFE